MTNISINFYNFPMYDTYVNTKLIIYILRTLIILTSKLKKINVIS